MRIAYDHQIFDWQRYGGVSRYFFELAQNIAGMHDGAVQARVVSPFYVNDYLHGASSPLRLTGLRAPAVRRTGRLYRAVNEALAPALMHAFAPDIVHETYYARRSVAPKKSKVVLTVFDMIHELFPAHGSAWDSTAAEKKLAVQRADHIICISHHTQQDLVRLLNVDVAKSSVIHLGFSLTQPAEIVGSPKRRPYVLFVGSRASYKNFANLLRAYASSQYLRQDFDLVAFGGGAFSNQELALIQQLGLSPANVQQRNGDDAALAQLYAQAACFVYPSLYEGFGIPPLEAMGFDCPVACSNTSSVPEVVGDAAQMFDPNSVEAIAHGLERVLSSADLQKQLIAKGRERVKQFSWETCARESLAVYENLLSA